MKSTSAKGPTKSIDRRSFEPAYMQIARTISEQIATGAYRAGDRLPSESELCTEFGVSPMTVRRAVNILVDRGLATAAQGKGTYVRSLALGEAVFRLQEMTDRWYDGSIDVRLLEASIAPATARVAEVLDCKPGERMVYLRRLLLRDEAPLMYHREYLVYDPRRPLVEAQLRITSLEGLLESAGGEGFPRGNLTVQAVGLSSEAADLLDLAPGSPALCLEHVFYDFSGRAMSWGWFLCRPDQFKLTSWIGAPEASGGGR